VIRQTIRQFITPDRLRGRMTSINMIFFMGGAARGAEALVRPLRLDRGGVTVSVVSGGIATVVIRPPSPPRRASAAPRLRGRNGPRDPAGAVGLQRPPGSGSTTERAS
jgi:hypothetical protein